MTPEISPIAFDILAAATALGALIQAGVLVGILIAFLKIQKKVEKSLDPIMEHAHPLIASTRLTLEELAPKLKVISSNLVDISETLKVESHNIKGSVDDVLAKTRVQTARVDEMVSGTLDGITQAGVAIQHGIEVPVRHLQGIFNGIRAGFGVFREKNHTSAATPMTADGAEFVAEIEEIIAAREVL